MLLRKIGLGLLLMMLVGCSLKAEPMPIQEAVDQGLIDLEFKSSGTSGDVILMIATGKTDRSIQLTIPAGQILDNQTTDHEDMVLMGYRGLVDRLDAEVFASDLPLVTKQASPRYGVIEAYSLELYAEQGNEDDEYSFDGFVDAELQGLIDYLAKQESEEFMAKQLAIWILTDNPDRETATEIIEFTDHDLEQARTFLLGANLNPNDYLIFE
ncbi:MAG TPA: hypothetical protein DEF47_13895 [Herpetosiphon sp.]|uniref:Lipoprotein n=1 Tax=Herpetosiphon aurantiacus (strain ATCC 23779 / DSM 785 / 114-95) TaxID=316274 RepID=A9AZN7_HERA2|nr:hypothetical protein [Herpetosiphon sp.]ABX07091.1 hypothetical protein Haur_4459 [Herpetosiphon aurantiacus DSM 785]HBW50981.1 hypothetical protein [Herpetosiphon sp.]